MATPVKQSSQVYGGIANGDLAPVNNACQLLRPEIVQDVLGREVAMHHRRRQPCRQWLASLFKVCIPRLQGGSFRHLIQQVEIIQRISPDFLNQGRNILSRHTQLCRIADRKLVQPR
jgi:hypothetical protein